MRTPDSSEILNVWERGRLEPSYSRALLLLAAAYPDSKPEDLAGLSIGRRDARLLRLRERLFGPRLPGITVCPACGEKLELSFDVSDILHGPWERQSSQLSLESEGYEIVFRLPDSSDLAALDMAGPDRQERRELVLKRCLSRVCFDGAQHEVDTLPTTIADAVSERMRKEDPLADIKLNLTCPACGNNWLASFDILSYFWSEIETQAKRLLREAHILARSYGWRESDILNMSAIRRQSYLDMLNE